MAGNTRGKLKEHFEGMHRNFDWLDDHCKKSILLIAGRTPELTDAVQALQTEINALDKLVQGLYSTI